MIFPKRKESKSKKSKKYGEQLNNPVIEAYTENPCNRDKNYTDP